RPTASSSTTFKIAPKAARAHPRTSFSYAKNIISWRRRSRGAPTRSNPSGSERATRRLTSCSRRSISMPAHDSRLLRGRRSARSENVRFIVHAHRRAQWPGSSPGNVLRDGLFPVLAVEGFHVEHADIDAVQTPRVNIHFVGVGARDVVAVDAAGGAE